MDHPTQEPGAARTILGRWLHLGLAVCITLCLLLSLCFVLPVGPQISGALVAFNLHKFIGLNGLFILCLYLMWTARGQAKAWSELFPWLSRERMACAMKEVVHPSEWLHMRAVPAMVQGLGIAFAAAAFVSGLFMVLAVLLPSFAAPDAVAAARALHRWSTSLLWVYLALHAGAVALHLACGGYEMVRPMFKLLDPEPIDYARATELAPLPQPRPEPGPVGQLSMIES